MTADVIKKTGDGLAKPTSYTVEDVADHHTADDCWITHKGKVYNVTDFLEGHPGGPDLILMYGGKDVSEVMHDASEHAHSDFAVEMLNEYLIGDLIGDGTSFKRKPSGPGEKAFEADPNFLDITKPLFWQMLNNNFTKDYYLEQVHIARHVKDGSSAPIFGGNLEYLTLTPWYVIPIVWLPLSAYMASVGLNYFHWIVLPISFLGGLALWTFLEYTVHRFFFHLDQYMPDHPKLFAIHFLAHGVHHFLPMDRYRLVMPPALFTLLLIPVFSFFHMFFSFELCCAVGSGVIFGYVAYDLCHFFLHHGRPPTEYLRELKTYHLNHHYKNWELGFGITTKFWDQVFGTELFNNHVKAQ